MSRNLCLTLWVYDEQARRVRERTPTPGHHCGPLKRNERKLASTPFFVKLAITWTNVHTILDLTGPENHQVCSD